MEVIITTKEPRLKLVRIMDILKGNVLSLTIIVDKILLKTIKVTTVMGQKSPRLSDFTPKLTIFAVQFLLL